jgi:hypothetical protein
MFQAFDRVSHEFLFTNFVSLLNISQSSRLLFSFVDARENSRHGILLMHGVAPFVEADSSYAVQMHLQELLHRVENWARESHVSFTPQKCEVLPLKQERALEVSSSWKEQLGSTGKIGT